MAQQHDDPKRAPTRVRPPAPQRAPARPGVSPGPGAGRYPVDALPDALTAGESRLAALDGALVQLRAAVGAARAPDDADVRAVAERGVRGPGAALPHAEQIQAAFGAHDLGGVTAHLDGGARTAAGAIGAQAYATGDHVAFAGAPDVHTAAHEAAHVVQQRSGVHLTGGVGQRGDAYERQADAVADRVVAGGSAADLLGPVSGGAGGAAVQRSAAGGLSAPRRAALEELARLAREGFEQAERELRETFAACRDDPGRAEERAFVGALIRSLPTEAEPDYGPGDGLPEDRVDVVAQETRSRRSAQHDLSRGEPEISMAGASGTTIEPGRGATSTHVSDTAEVRDAGDFSVTHEERELEVQSRDPVRVRSTSQEEQDAGAPVAVVVDDGSGGTRQRDSRHTMTRDGDEIRETESTSESVRGQTRSEERERRSAGDFLADHVEVSEEVTLLENQGDVAVGDREQYAVRVSPNTVASMVSETNAVSHGEDVTATANAGEESLELSGNAGVRWRPVGHDFRIETTSEAFRLVGESMDVVFAAGLTSEIVAQVGGNVKVDVDTSDGRAELGVEAGAEAFAGTRLSVSAEASLRWHKRGSYRDVFRERFDVLLAFLQRHLPIPDVPAAAVETVANHAADLIMGGGGGSADLFVLSAGAQAAAGVGGGANFTLGISNGMIETNATASATLGVGVGGNITARIALLDGSRIILLGLLRGREGLAEDLHNLDDVAATIWDAAGELVHYVVNLPSDLLADAMVTNAQAEDAGFGALQTSQGNDLEAVVNHATGARHDRELVQAGEYGRRILLALRNGEVRRAVDNLIDDGGLISGGSRDAARETVSTFECIVGQRAASMVWNRRLDWLERGTEKLESIAALRHLEGGDLARCLRGSDSLRMRALELLQKLAAGNAQDAATHLSFRSFPMGEWEER